MSHCEGFAVAFRSRIEPGCRSLHDTEEGFSAVWCGCRLAQPSCSFRRIVTLHGIERATGPGAIVAFPQLRRDLGRQPQGVRSLPRCQGRACPAAGSFPEVPRNGPGFGEARAVHRFVVRKRRGPGRQSRGVADQGQAQGHDDRSGSDHRSQAGRPRSPEQRLNGTSEDDADRRPHEKLGTERGHAELP